MTYLLILLLMLSPAEVAERIRCLSTDKQGEAAFYALHLYGAADAHIEFEPTRYNPAAYIQKYLGWTPWRGIDANKPGQMEVFDQYVLALRQQHEKEDYEWERIAERDLKYWKPGQVIQNQIRVESGHGNGKTKCGSGLVNHFIDHFKPSVIYTFAPTWHQIKDLLWKEIGFDRRGKGLPGRLLDTCEIRVSDNHFAKGKVASNAGGKGTERVHGQHERYQLFLLDEAEGVADFVYEALPGMMSGGISVAIFFANPRTRTSNFHKLGSSSSVKTFRISCINHPNVIQGREVIPGAVKRQYVLEMLEKHVDVVRAHDHDNQTFTLPFAVTLKGVEHPAGTVFKPNSEFMFRVLGIAPANISDKNLVPVGRYEAACNRNAKSNHPEQARAGVDVSRFGKDYGTFYIKWNGRVWRERQFYKLDTIEYYMAIREAMLDLKRQSVEGIEYKELSDVIDKGITSLHIRIDGGGGFGGGVIDDLRADLELREAFEDFQVFECHFNGTPNDEAAFADCITEWTADAAESLKGLSVENPPEELKADLCEREYEWVNREGKAVKKLEDKKGFKKRVHRSPDDGDGFVLAVALDHLFAGLIPDVY